MASRPEIGRRLLALLAVAALALVATGCGSDGGSAGGDGGSGQLEGLVRTPPLEVGATSLPQVAEDGTETPFAFKAPAGGLLFVAFGYTSDAEAECAAFHKRSGRIIKLITVREILDEQFVQKM